MFMAAFTPLKISSASRAPEITSILIDAESDLKFQAYNVLRETDSANLSEYESLQE